MSDAAEALVELMREIARQEIRRHEAETAARQPRPSRLYTVREWANKGLLKAQRSLGGGKLLFSEAEIERCRGAAEKGAKR